MKKKSKYEKKSSGKTSEKKSSNFFYLKYKTL